MPHPDSPARPTWARFAVLALLCLAAASAYVCRTSLNVAAEAVRKELIPADVVVLGFTLTPIEQMGWIMFAFFFSYTIFQLPGAWFVREVGTRASLPLFALLWSAASAASALATGWLSLIGVRFGMGVAQAAMFTATTQTIARWFPAHGRAFPSGALASFMSVGGALGTYVTAEVLSRHGNATWRLAFVAYALPGVVWAAGFWLWFRESPAEHASVNAAERDLIGVPAKLPPPEPTPWLALLTSAPMLLICVQQFFRAAGYIFFATWFPTYLRETRGVEMKDLGLLSSLPLAAVVLGSPCGGAASDWVLRRTGSRRLSRQGVSLASLIGCASLAALAYPVADPVVAVLLISCGQFCHAAAGPCAYAITLDMGGRHLTSVFSLMNMAGNLGAMLFPLAVAQLVKAEGGRWEVVLPLYVGIALAAAVAWAFINPNGTIVDPRERRRLREDQP